MAERRNMERGLVDAWTAELGGPQSTALLGRLDDAIPWETLVKPILRLPEWRRRPRAADPHDRP